MTDGPWQISSALSPVSPQAHAISELLISVIILVSVVGLVVIGLVTWSIVRYRVRGDGEPPQVEGSATMEMIYTGIPLAIMVTLFVYTVRTMNRAEPSTIGKDPELVIIGHQWWWEVRYPMAGVVTANEIHLPLGRPLVAELRSADVIHELWVPQIGPKLADVPGQTNRLLIESNSEGTFLGQCAEFCGAGHAWMRVRVIVQPPDQFRQWEQEQRSPPEPVRGDAARGRQLFLSRTCIQCHSIEDTSTEGHAGPDLTHVASRATLAAGALENTPDNLKQWLSDPQLVKPGCHMPNMHLSADEINELTAYLESLK
ncbi:MAG TPA: cytochrome c oxidase subunit II [Tepidisphaeraceae bacterium]|jgi:cytochrome c oxidase subunit 2|nr:cytochrome c oxidase subunit II [Tepidisphaeraceae bacterium]